MSTLACQQSKSGVRKIDPFRLVSFCRKTQNGPQRCGLSDKCRDFLLDLYV
jgi:hypothetical protein